MYKILISLYKTECLKLNCKLGNGNIKIIHFRTFCVDIT